MNRTVTNEDLLKKLDDILALLKHQHMFYIQRLLDIQADVKENTKPKEE